MINHKLQILLGSASPRRRALLAGLDIPFTAASIDADESYPASLEGGDIPIYISRAKARAYARELHDDELLITADTIVWLNGTMLGNPHDAEQARSMLHLLAGQTHQVYTAVSFTWLRPAADSVSAALLPDMPLLRTDTLVDVTDVTFGNLSDEEIAYYVERYRPFDKAGAYGVQEWIGYIGVTAMHGSYFNVMGLPIQRLYTELKSF
jgi:septum formation protein